MAWQISSNFPGLCSLISQLRLLGLGVDFETNPWKYQSKLRFLQVKTNFLEVLRISEPSRPPRPNISFKLFKVSLFNVSLFLFQMFFSKFPAEAFEMLLMALKAFPRLTFLHLDVNLDELDEAHVAR